MSTREEFSYIEMSSTRFIIARYSGTTPRGSGRYVCETKNETTARLIVQSLNKTGLFSDDWHMDLKS
ncbi:hypothetical protein LCGC14_0231660 [marine sediment metagenome]|uniref:Uncharacterized protein n=1 Tax=marine sediment metagenome TaxID=412755 RepID=A0A0F9XE51_9ZZZZ